MVATRSSKNTTDPTKMVDKTPAKKGRSGDVEVTPSVATAALPRRTCRKTAGVHTRGSGIGTTATAIATTKTTDKKKPPRMRTPAAKPFAAGKRKTGSTSDSASSAPSKTPKVATTKSSRPPANSRKSRSHYRKRKAIGIATAYALVDPDVCNPDPAVPNLSFAQAYAHERGRHAAMKAEMVGTGTVDAARVAWNRHLSDVGLQREALGMVFTDLQAKAAAGVLLEDLDPASRTAVDTLGGAAVFGFGTAPAPAPAAGAGAAGTASDIVRPGPSAASTADTGADAMPAWWRQAYAEQQEKNREMAAQQIKDRAELQAQNQSMLNQLGNSNLIQQQMLGRLDNHDTAIGALQNGQQQQGAAIVDLQNGQQQQRAAIAELQDWQQRLIVEGAVGGTKANLDNLRFESDPSCSAAPPAAIGVHDTAGAAQAAPIVHAGGSPPSSDKKMPARPVPFSSAKADDKLAYGFGGSDEMATALQSVRRSSPSLGRGRAIFGTGTEIGAGALAGDRSANGLYPSSPPNTFSPSTNRKKSAKPSPSPSPSRPAAPSFGSLDAVVGTGTPKNPRAAITGGKRPSSPSSKVGLFDESMGGYNADASTPPTAMAVTGRTYVRRHPLSRPPPLKMRPEPEPEVPVQGRFETDFEIIGLPIGSGSFGTVYKCRNNWDRQCYAVKKIAPHRRGQTGRDRMLKEVQALAALCSRDDPAVFYHIVRYCQAWIQEGHLYIQMELCTSTLQAELEVSSSVASASDTKVEIPAKRKPMSSGRRYKLLREILLALEFIHKNNMCHLDIKPDNIFIKNDRFKLGVSIDNSRGEGFYLLSLSLYIRHFHLSFILPPSCTSLNLS